MKHKVLLDSQKIDIVLHRLACQLLEKHIDFSNTVLLGLQPRGVYLSHRIEKILKEKYGISSLLHGKLDITFFRDDFRRSDKIITAQETNLDFSIENKSVVLIDDVLFTGRSVRAALTAIDTFGRPKEVELLILIDRRFSRLFPIYPDYIGVHVDSIENNKVKVEWKENEQKDAVYLIE